jgi:hypothetical protein
MLVLAIGTADAHPPVASYIFPAGGQRGTSVDIKVGGLFLHDECPFELTGPGVKASPKLTRTKTLWFDGPLLPLPESQQSEDYPRDMAGRVAIAKDAALGVRFARIWTSQGVAPSVKFLIGELPEIVEVEIDGEPLPVLASPPVTINGRIFPRQDVDAWSFHARKGETFSCVVNAARLGSPLDARLEVVDPDKRLIAENDDARGNDPAVRFTAPADGVYEVKIRDAQLQGGQAYVYRLTITKGSVVDRVFPLGARRGDTVAIDLEGQAVPKSVDVAIPASAERVYRPKEIPEPIVEPVLLDIDDVPEFVEGRGLPTAPFQTPIVVNGRIASAGESDEWAIAAKKATPLRIEMRAARLGSALDAVTTIVDASGKELAKLEGDKSLDWTPAVDGSYRIRVRDRFRSRGGAAFAYRLKIAPPSAPDYELSVPSDAVTLLRKGQTKLKVNVVRIGGSHDAVAIAAENLPAGVVALPLVVPGNQPSGELMLKADADAPVSSQAIRIVGTLAPKPPLPVKGKVDADSGDDAGPPRVATVAVARGETPPDLRLAVGVATPFVIKGEYDMGFAARGGLHRRKYSIERNGYDGPIEISLADKQARHLQGVTAPSIVVPAGESTFTYEAYLPPWMELGRTCRVCVQGVGVIKVGEQHHKVVFSSTNQNEQLVAVVGPGQLAMELDRPSVVLSEGKAADVGVRIRRGLAWKGPVEIALVTIGCVTAEPLTIPAEAEQGVLRLRRDASPRMNGGPITIRATLRQGTQYIVAEASLEAIAE